MMRNVTATAIVLALAAAASAQVTDLKACYRQGQVFITFKELADVKGEQYAVFASDRKLDAAGLAQARRVGAVAEDSGADAREKRIGQLAKKTGVANYGHRYFIEDNPTNDPAKMLPEGTGLFVLTVKKPGKGFYAVAPVVGGQVDAAKLAATAEAVDEKVELPGAVLAWKNEAGTGFVFTHWMDGETWDPMSEGNAYNFGLALPDSYDGKSPLPVMFYGHGMGESYGVMDKASYWPALWVKPCDKSGSWFFGMLNRDKTKVVNYVEQRVRWMAAWLQAGYPNQPWKVDPLRYQGHGHSMGGTFCNALAMRMGDIFCTTVSSCGATIHRRNKTWVNGSEKLWGPVDQNLPVLLRLVRYEPAGVKVEETSPGGAWDYQDYAKWSLDHMGQETAYLILDNASNDGSVVWEPVPDFVAALEKSKRPFAAFWNPRGHSNRFGSTKNDAMGGYKIPLNQSLVAFANASNNDDITKGGSGSVNGRLEWCAPGNDFDKASKDDDLVDTAEMWATNLRALPRKAGEPAADATVDVTPRRCQQFKPKAGAKIDWEVIDFSTGSAGEKLGSGTVTADKYGLVTVEKVKVPGKGMGSRLSLKVSK